MVNLLLDDVIDKETFNKKNNELKCDILNISQRISGHTAANQSYVDTMSNLTELANNSGNLFLNSSNMELKRLLIKTVFRTLEIKDGNVGYSLSFPFSEFVKCADFSIWRPRRDSNARPQD